MADLMKWVQAQPFQLAGSGAALGATSIVLQSFKDIDGTNLALTDFGTLGFMTMEPGSGTQEEAITFSGVTQNANGTATLTGVKTQLFKDPYTQTSGLAKSHAGGTSVILTNSAGFYQNFAVKNDDETITGVWTFPNDASTPLIGASYVAPTIDNQVATKKYADDIAVAGAPNANTTTKGIVQIATQAQADARTSVGSTGASLVPTPALNRTVLTHDYVASAVGTDAYAITCTPAVTAYTVGDIYTFGADVANTGPATLAVNGLTAKPIVKAHDVALETGDIEAGQIVTVVYDGTSMQMQSQTGLSGDFATKAGVQNESYTYAADVVGTDAYAITLTPTPATYAAGQAFTFKAGAANTGAATLAVNGQAAKNILKGNGATLETGDIFSGQVVQVVYDGTQFQMQSPSASILKTASLTSQKNLSDATGGVDNIAHGLGKVPKMVIVTCGFGKAGDIGSTTTGSYDGTNQNYAGMHVIGSGTGVTLGSASAIATAVEGAATALQTATATWDATNITLTWAKTGSPTGTAQLSLMVFA